MYDHIAFVPALSDSSPKMDGMVGPIGRRDASYEVTASMFPEVPPCRIDVVDLADAPALDAGTSTDAFTKR